MPKFGTASTSHLKQAHPLLQKLFNAVILKIDCTILDAQRDRADQEAAYKAGNSHAHFGESAHNYVPSVALDVIPYPFKGWTGKAALADFRRLATVVKQTAKELGIDITWGGDWKTIVDLPHYELSNWLTLVKAKKVKLYED